jgi:ligand-binding sensor domain-containing protein
VNILRFIALLSILVSAYSDARSQPFYFSHYQVESGLSNNSVISSLIDHRGFMWFGTKDGLNRFDGYTYKVFRNDPKAKSSLRNNYIGALHLDNQHILWVGTERGVFRYDERFERFNPVPNTPNELIRGITSDKNDNLWFIGGYVLYRYSKGKLKSYAQEFDATAVCCASDGTIWAGTSTGFLQRYDPKSDRFTEFDLFDPAKPATSHWIEKICPDGPGRLLVATSNQAQNCSIPA